jgi:hypothetical protein
MASNAPGYLYNPDSSSSSSALKEPASGITYDDNDLKHVIAHNLGVLDLASEIKESAKDAILKFGSKALLKQQKINYLFMVESSTSGIVNIENLGSEKSAIKHKNALFNLCSGESTEQCVLDLLYNPRKIILYSA